jgi:ABC-type uncharacterized transport system permease subunit
MLGNTFWTNVALSCFALATLLLIPATKPRHFSNYQFRLGALLLTGGTIAVSFSTFGRYDSRIWVDAASLLLATFVSWLSLVAVYFLRIRSFAAPFAALTTLLLLIHSFFADTGDSSSFTGSSPEVLIGFHILFSIVGESFVIFAGAIGFLYVKQEHRIRSRQINLIPDRMPALDRLEWWLSTSLWFGFAFITTGLVTGAVYTSKFVVESTMALQAKIAWSLFIWLVYFCILLAKYLFSKPSRTIAWCAAAGLALLTVTIFGLGFFAKGVELP